MKTGHHGPCPCNSGKKYKQCCLKKDVQLAVNRRKAQEKTIKSKNRGEEPCFPDEDFINLELNGEIEYCTSRIVSGHGDILPELIKLYRENTSKEFYSIYDDYEDDSLKKEELSDAASDELISTQSYSFNEDDLVPAISPEEDALVDVWWKKRGAIKDPIAELEHIKSFLHAHPHLDANMSLHYEVIFDLQRKFETREDYPLFIEFLTYYREKHPNAYTLSFAYYDTYLITYSLVQQKSNEEIALYFSLFKKYPLKFIDNFMDVVFMIISFGREELLETLYQDIYIPLDRSESLFNHASIIEPYLLCQWNPFVKKFLTSAGTQSEIVDALHEKQVGFNSQLENVDIHIGKKRIARLLEECFGDLPRPSYPHPFDYVETKKFYTLIINNFTGYQVRTLLRPWVLSHNISVSIFNLLMYPLERNKIPRHPFRFSKDLINDFARRRFRSFSSDKMYEKFCFLYGLVNFCNYLKETELISTDEFQQLHEAATSMLDRFCERSDEYVMTYYRALVKKEKHKRVVGNE